MTPGIARVGDVVFGSEPKLRLRVQRWLLAAVIYLIWMVLEVYAASTGIIPWASAWLMIGYNVTGLLTFYGLLRSGLSVKLRDPSLTLEQELYAIGAILIAYVLVPPTRAAALQGLGVTLVFGMFTLKPREIVMACAATVGMLLATLAVMWIAPPAHFDPRRETINALLACIVLTALGLIVRNFAQMRERVLAQRAELKTAVARVEQLATRDALTELYSRRHGIELMEQEQRRQQRNGAPLAVAIIDLDHFKRINDSWGHAAGDAVLCGFAQATSHVFRQTDAVVRWGGEEFLVIFPESSTAQALGGLQRLRAHLAEQQLCPAAPGLTVTFSAGVAAIRPGEALGRAVERADAALYAAKSAGRDRSQVAPEDEVRVAPPPRAAHCVAAVTGEH